MKKLLLVLLSGTVSLLSNAQEIIYTQDFQSPTITNLASTGFTAISADTDTGVATDWNLWQSGSNIHLISASWYNNVVYNPDNYLFSPAINLTGVTGTLKLSWKHSSPDADYDAEKYSVYITTSPTIAAAQATTAIHNVPTMNNINSFAEVSVDVSQYAGQTIYVCYRHYGVSDQFYLFIDDITVAKVFPNDAALQSVNVPSIVTAGNQNVTGVIKNTGTSAITSFDLNYTINGGTLVTQSYTGQNIAPGATYNFTHNVPFTTSVGQAYNISVSVTNANANDNYASNNSKDVFTQVPSGSTAYKPMFEKFTSSTCAPCASYNNSTFNAFYAAQNANFNYVAYQMNWPGAGDPYYSATDGLARRNYYGVSSITDLKINGSTYSTSNNQAVLTTYTNTEAAKPSYFILQAGREIVNNTATVNYVIEPYVTGNYTIQAAVIEKTTSNNVSTNGETSFKHVMMKMVPNASGTSISTTAGTQISGQISASLAGTFIEEMSDLEVVVFIQDNATKQVMQSTTATVGLLGNDKFNKNIVNIFPNPATNHLTIGIEELVNVTITDLTGKIILSIAKVNNEKAINIEALAPGIYMVNVSNNNTNETIKLIKK